MLSGNGWVALLDDEVARAFARVLNVRVKGSLGVMVEVVRKGILTGEVGLKALGKLASVMYVSVDVYRAVKKEY